METKKVIIAGGGVLGSQISLMCAFIGHDTTILIRPEDDLKQTQAKLSRYSGMMIEDLESCKEYIGKPAAEAKYPHGLIRKWEGITFEKIDELKLQVENGVRNNIRITSCKDGIFEDAYIVIEAVSENPDVKTDFYLSVRDLLPADTLIVTNSSTLIPSRFAEATGRPEKYCALHFANTIWRCNTAEIMRHEGTDPDVFDKVVEFAEEINMIPLRVMKEQPGYILNSMLVPWLAASEALWVNGIADPETIDLTWKVGFGSPVGPFEHIDVIGLDTVYNINLMKPDVNVEGSVINRLSKMLKEKIDRGETGVNAGIGFYDYRNR